MNTNPTVAPVKATAPHQLIDFWPRFTLFPTLAVVLYPPFVMGWGGDGWLVQSAWVVFLTYCYFCVGGAFHEAAHHTLFKRQSWNVWYGRMVGSLVFIPYTVYKESHRRHHAYLNTPADYELWPYCDPECSLAFRRFFVWVDIIGGVITNPYIYGRIYLDRDSGLSDKVRRTIFWEYVGAAVFWVTLVTGVIVYANQTGFQWSEFRFVWLLPLLLSPCVNTVRKFVEHLGMTSRDPILGTRTVVPGNSLSRLFCYFNFDIGIHGPHHRYPKAHHYELEPKIRSYIQEHPEAPVPQFSSYLSATWDTLPYLWTRPATGDHGEEVAKQHTAAS